MQNTVSQGLEGRAATDMSADRYMRRLGFVGASTEFAAVVDERVGVLAGQVIALLRAREGRSMPLDEARCMVLSDRIVAAAMAPDPAVLPALYHALLREQVSADMVTDLVLPAAARELGRGWETDRISFVDVSLAMVRLQRLLRDDINEVAIEGRAGSLLLILPEGEQHTFGALVAARQLRRLGFSVCLSIGASAGEVASLARSRAFDAALVSVGTVEHLVTAKKLTTSLHDGLTAALPVVLGGAALTLEGQSVEQIATATGANLVTNDLSGMLRALGLDSRLDRVAESA